MRTLLLIALMTFTTLTYAKEQTMKHTLKEEIKLSEASKTVKVLTKGTFNLIGLGFKKDQVLEKHKTPTPAVLIVQSGSVEFKISDNTYLLKAGDYFEIPVDVEHEVIGKEDSYLYLVK